MAGNNKRNRGGRRGGGNSGGGGRAPGNGPDQNRGGRPRQERREPVKEFNIGDIIDSDKVRDLRIRRGKVEVVTADGGQQVMEVQYPRLQQLEALLDEARKRDGKKPAVQIVAKKEKRQGDTVTGYIYEAIIAPEGADASDFRDEAIAYERSRRDQKLESGGIFYNARIQKRIPPNEYIAKVANPSGRGEVAVRILTNKVLSNDDLRRPAAIGIIGEVQQQAGKIDGRQTFRAVLLDDPQAYDAYHRGAGARPDDEFKQYTDPATGKVAQLEAILQSPLRDGRGTSVEARGTAREIAGTNEWLIDRKRPTGDGRAIRVRSVLNQGVLDDETHFRVVRAREEQTEVLSIPEQEYQLIAQYVRAGSLFNHYTDVFEQALLHEDEVPAALQPQFLKLIDTIHDKGLMQLVSVISGDPMTSIGELYNAADPAAKRHETAVNTAQAVLRRATMQLDALLPDSSWLQASRFPAGGESATRDSYRVADDFGSRMSQLDIQQGAKGRNYDAIGPRFRKGIQGTSREMTKYAAFLSEQEMRRIDHGGDAYVQLVEEIQEGYDTLADFDANQSIEFGGVYNVSAGTTKETLKINSSFTELVDEKGKLIQDQQSWDLVKGDTLVDIQVLPTGQISFDTIARRTKREALKSELQQEAAGAADSTVIKDLLLEIQTYGPTIVDKSYFLRQILLIGRKDTNAQVRAVENIDDQEAGAMRANLHAASFEEVAAYINGRKSGTGLDVAVRQYQQIDTENDPFAREARSIILGKVWGAVESALGDTDLVQFLKDNGINFQIAASQDLTNEALQCTALIDGKELVTSVDIHPDASQSSIGDVVNALRTELADRRAEVERVKRVRFNMTGMLANKEACNRILLAHGFLSAEIPVDDIATPIEVVFTSTGVYLDLQHEIIRDLPESVYEELIGAGAFEMNKEHVELAATSFEQLVAFINGTPTGTELDSVSHGYAGIESGSDRAAVFSRDIIDIKLWQAVVDATGDLSAVQRLRAQGVQLIIAESQNRKNASLQCEVRMDGEVIMPSVDIHPDEAQSTIPEMMRLATAHILEQQKRLVDSLHFQPGIIGVVNNVEAVSRILKRQGVIATDLSFPAGSTVTFESLTSDEIRIGNKIYDIDPAVFKELQIKGGLEVRGSAPQMYFGEKHNGVVDWAWNERFADTITAGDVFVYNGQPIAGKQIFMPGTRVMISYTDDGGLRLYNVDVLGESNKWNLNDVHHIEGDTFIAVKPEYLAAQIKKGNFQSLEASAAGMAEYLADGGVPSVKSILNAMDLNPVTMTYGGGVTAEFYLKDLGYIEDTSGTRHAALSTAHPGEKRLFTITDYDRATNECTVTIEPDGIITTVSAEYLLQKRESDADIFVTYSDARIAEMKAEYESLSWDGLKDILADKGLDVSSGIPTFYTNTPDAVTPRRRHIDGIHNGMVIIQGLDADSVEQEIRMPVAEFLHAVDVGMRGQRTEPAFFLGDASRQKEVTDRTTFIRILEKQNIFPGERFVHNGVVYSMRFDRGTVILEEAIATGTTGPARVESFSLQEFLNHISSSTITAEATVAVAALDKQWAEAQKGEAKVLLDKAMLLHGIRPEDIYDGLYLVDNVDPNNNGRCSISTLGSPNELTVTARKDDGTVSISETWTTVEVLRKIVNGELVTRHAAIQGKFDTDSHLARQRQEAMRDGGASSRLIAALNEKLPRVYKLPGLRSLKVAEDVRTIQALATEFDTLAQETLQTGSGFEHSIPAEIRALLAEQATFTSSVLKQVESGKFLRSVEDIRAIEDKYRYFISAVKMERYMQDGHFNTVNESDIHRVLEGKAGVDDIRRTRFMRAQVGGRYGSSCVPVQMSIEPNRGWVPTSGEDKYIVRLQSKRGESAVYQWTDFLEMLADPTDERVRVARESEAADLQVHRFTDRTVLRNISQNLAWTARGRAGIEQRMSSVVTHAEEALNEIDALRNMIDFTRSEPIEQKYLQSANTALSKKIDAVITDALANKYKTEGDLYEALDDILDDIDGLKLLYAAHKQIENGRMYQLPATFMDAFGIAMNIELADVNEEMLEEEYGITFERVENINTGLVEDIRVVFTPEGGGAPVQHSIQHAIEKVLADKEDADWTDRNMSEPAEPAYYPDFQWLGYRYEASSTETTLIKEVQRHFGGKNLNEILAAGVRIGSSDQVLRRWRYDVHTGEVIFSVSELRDRTILREESMSLREFCRKLITDAYTPMSTSRDVAPQRTISGTDFTPEYSRFLPEQDVIALRRIERQYDGLSLEQMSDGWLRSNTGDSISVERDDGGRVFDNQTLIKVTIGGVVDTSINTFAQILTQLDNGRFEVQNPDPEFGPEQLDTDKPDDPAAQLDWAFAAFGITDPQERAKTTSAHVRKRGTELRRIYDARVNPTAPEADAEKAKRIADAQQIFREYFNPPTP